jgi:hypothetical protein
MKRSNQSRLTKELKILFIFGVIILLLYSALPDYYSTSYVQAQLQLQQQQPQHSPPIISVKITSPNTSQQVTVGELTISGISTDNATSDCTVYADWNNTKPFQKAIAAGPGGVDDYSKWNYTYTDKYHLITNGTNNLTSKLSCINNGGGTANLTKNYSVNVIGVAARTTNNTTATTSAEEVQHQSLTIDTNNTATIFSNETRVVKGEGLTATENISSPTSIPIPLITNNFTLDRVNINITSHRSGQEIPVGNFRIAGHSSDNIATDCTVYAGWDGQNPLQIAKALGPGGVNDYSSWVFTYKPTYHVITNGTNELTAQISCLDGDYKNDKNDKNNNNNNTNSAYLTKYYKINVTGVVGSPSSSFVRGDNVNNTKTATTTPPESIPSDPTPSQIPSSPSTQKQQEEEPQPEPEPQPEDNGDTTIYWDMEYS